MLRSRWEARSRPPWVTTTRGRSRKTRDLIRTGSPPWRAGSARFGTTQCNGSATSTRSVAHRTVRSPPWRSHSAAARPTDSGPLCGHVCRLGRMHDVARGEDPGGRRHPPGRTGGTAGTGIDGETGQAGQLVVRDEVPAEDDGVDGHRALVAARTPDEHPVHSVAPVDAGHRRAGPDRHPEAHPDQEVEQAIGLGARKVRDESDRVDPGVPQRHDRRVGDMLSADNDGASADGAVLTVDPLLELAGGEYPGGPRPRNQAGRPWPLPWPRWPARSCARPSRAPQWDP